MFGRGKTLLAKDEDISLLTYSSAIDSRMVVGVDQVEFYMQTPDGPIGTRDGKPIRGPLKGYMEGLIRAYFPEQEVESVVGYRDRKKRLPHSLEIKLKNGYKARIDVVSTKKVKETELPPIQVRERPRVPAQ